MRLSIIVHPGSSKQTVVIQSDIRGQDIYHIYMSAKPIDGQANAMLIDMLADYL
jgi:uncharacterized protein YggU (UPF0235/DUF167 family)